MDSLLAWMNSSGFPSWNADFAGYVASALVLAAFVMPTMVKLRVTALASNIAFIYYAMSVDIRPVLILHGILLPVNIFRLLQIELDRKKTRQAASAVKPEAESPRRRCLPNWSPGKGGMFLPVPPTTVRGRRNRCESR
jgi:hypothetical protein